MDAPQVNLIITGLSGLVGAGAAWFTAQKTFDAKKSEIIPKQMELVLDGWRQELVRLRHHVNTLESERDALIERIHDLEALVEKQQRELVSLKEAVLGYQPEKNLP